MNEVRLIDANTVDAIEIPKNVTNGDMIKTLFPRGGRMSKLIDVDDIDWQKGVFVNPNTDEPLPIIHKIATVEMLRDWQEEVKAIPLDKVKDVREEISDWDVNKAMNGCSEPFKLGVARGLDIASEILDKLIAESEESE